MNRSVAAFAAVATLLSAASIAHADTDFGEQRQVVVSYGDLDLAKASGQQVLTSRIDQAAAAICGPAPGIRQMADHQRYSACVRHTADRAIASLGGPSFAGLTGQSTVIASN